MPPALLLEGAVGRPALRSVLEMVPARRAPPIDEPIPRLERSEVPELTRPLRDGLVLERKPSLRGEVVERTLALREGESLRLGVLKALLRSEELRLELRLELLNELLRLDELLELLRLELLNELCPLLLLLRLLLIDELLWLLPPPRLPPPRCASAGVALSARAIIAKVIHFEVFISLLLSFVFIFAFVF